MTAPVLLSRHGALATLTLNRPDTLNALDHTMMRALVAHTSALAADRSVHCVVLQGAGRHFMAGGDLRTFADQLGRPPGERQQWFRDLAAAVHAAIEHLRRMPAPVVARLHGAVAGFGLSLVGACDLAIAADDTYFAAAYRNIGLSPDGGGTYTLPRVVGAKKAAEILLLGERFDAGEALRLGLVNRVVPVTELDAATAALTEAVLRGPAIALARTKRLLAGSSERSLSEQLNAEAEALGATAATADFGEGLEAFLAKRPPRFTGA